MSIFKKGTISAHIEINNICNAFCPQCQRNVINKDNKVVSRNGLNDSQLSLDEYKSIFNKFGLKKVALVFSYPIRRYL